MDGEGERVRLGHFNMHSGIQWLQTDRERERISTDYPVNWCQIKYCLHVHFLNTNIWLMSH